MNGSAWTKALAVKPAKIDRIVPIRFPQNARPAGTVKNGAAREGVHLRIPIRSFQRVNDLDGGIVALDFRTIRFLLHENHYFTRLLSGFLPLRQDFNSSAAA